MLSEAKNLQADPPTPPPYFFKDKYPDRLLCSRWQPVEAVRQEYQDLYRPPPTGDVELNLGITGQDRTTNSAGGEIVARFEEIQIAHCG